MVKGILYKYLLKAILVALIGLVLFGFFPSTALAVILILFVGLRLTSLAAEALRQPIPEPAGGAMSGEVMASALQKITPAFPRRKMELGAEALGVVAFALLLPLGIALYTRDFFSLRAGQGWVGAGVAVLCLALYAWPHVWLKSPGTSLIRILWWGLPFMPALLILDYGIEVRHPYLNPFNPERNRLAAERVLSLKNYVVAARHSDWVLRYARQLDEQGDTQQAVHFYREGLRLDPDNRQACARLVQLEPPSSVPPQRSGIEPFQLTAAPYWTSQRPVIPSSRRRIDSQLENVEGCTVVIIPVGEAPDEVLDAVAYVVQQELDLPVCVSPDPVPLPPNTRVRGLVTGAQWDEASIVQAFTNATRFFPKAPIKYLLVTPVDLYINEANYVISTSYPWGGLVSFARFGGPSGGSDLLRQRTAKQALCALIKSFNIRPSTDRNCVTSYARSLAEFDAKGSRPNAETLKLFRQGVAQVNGAWRRRKAMSSDAPDHADAK